MDLSVLLFREEGCWVAQCLQFDIAAQAMTIDDVIYEFQRVLVGHMAIHKELNLPALEEEFPPAPEVYWRQFQKAARLDKTMPRMSVPSVPVDIARTEIRITD